MRRLAIAAVTVLGVLAGPVSPAAPQAGHGMPEMPGMAGAALATPAQIGFDLYSPSQLTVLAGDTVTWSNMSVRPHTVTAADESWSSNRVFTDETFSHRFDTVGAVEYFCRLHPSMRGVVDVRRVLLAPPAAPAAPGRPFPISGRSSLPAGSAIAIEADDGTGYKRMGATTVGADGTFSTTVTPRAIAAYRAVAGAESSPSVQILVLDRKVVTKAGPPGRRVVVSAQVAPASPGATVVLQLRLKHRFGWWPVRREKLGAGSTARFAMRLGHAVPARVVLTLPDGATVLSTSRTFRVGPRTHARAHTQTHPHHG